MKNISISTLSFATLLSLLLTAVAQGEEPLAIVDFDKHPAKYQFSYAFGGYGPPDGSDSISISEKVSASHSLDATSGRTDAGTAEKNACGKAVLDTTKATVPFDASYEYAGLGSGACYDLSGKKLGAFDPEGLTVSFDAKVSGAASLNQSKLMLNFVVEDGADEDDHDDVVLRMVQGQDDGTGTFSIGDEWKTLSFPMSELEVAEGSLKALADAPLIGINFTVQAQGAFTDFGTDKDNVLLIDNLKIVKSK